MNRVGKIITIRCLGVTDSSKKKKTDVLFGILISRTNMFGREVSKFRDVVHLNRYRVWSILR